jgi:SIR2-like protein
MAHKIGEADWKLLLMRIEEGKCTPFLGAGVCYGTLPGGANLAQDWANEEGFPLDDCSDLAKVSQFLAVTFRDAIYPKDKLIKKFKGIAPPNFKNPLEPHGLLAELPLPLYITTNYDDFMFRALKESEYAPGFKKNPSREICKWNKQIRKKLDEGRGVKKRSIEGDLKNPVVFHLHGTTDHPESMVLTEDDYLDFLINLAREGDLLPHSIEKAFSDTSLLFIGYSLSDWNFRVLFRSVVQYLERSLQRAHISVQLAPVKEGASPERRRGAEEYLNSYFDPMRIRVYWGTAEQFVQELRQRWDERRKHTENGTGS